MRMVFAFLACAACIGHTAIAEEPVSFTDQNLKTAIEAQLGLIDPTPTDMLALTTLSFRGHPYREDRSVTDLTGLEYAQNLVSLALENNHHLDNTSLLAQLPRLRELDLSWNKIDDITALGELANLTSLDLENNTISDISPLAGLIHLQTLILRKNSVQDISPLYGLNHLKLLDLDDNALDTDVCNHRVSQIIDNNPGVKVIYCHQTNRSDFPHDRFAARSSSTDSVSIRWTKFIIRLEPYDANIVHFQDSTTYTLHYEFATQHLEPFIGVTMPQFNEMTLHASNQTAVLGSVFFPPSRSPGAYVPQANEMGVEFVRDDPFTPEEIRDLLNLVKNSIQAPNDVTIFYFPKYEQQEAAEANRAWFAAEGIPLGSTAQWLKGNTCYSEGWALGTLKFVGADDIVTAYTRGQLLPTDILLTDGIPAELPYMAGIISLAPSTPNSHVAILARSYAIPFAHLALTADAQRAQDLVGRKLFFSAYDNLFGCDTRIIDVDEIQKDPIVDEILTLKETQPLTITPMATHGQVGLPTELLQPADIQYVGGKAAHFSILREAIPDNSPRSLGLTFDVWNAFLDQSLADTQPLILEPGEYLLLWADNDEEQGPLHVGFRLNREGEFIGLYDTDGHTLIDAVTFGPQTTDVSYGRHSDGGSQWQSLAAPTPGQANAAGVAEPGAGLVINELMADNQAFLEDPCETGEYPDWIELYNASDQPISLNGLYLTDDVNDPTKWQLATLDNNMTLREKITQTLAAYPSYPPDDMLALADDLTTIRSLFTDSDKTRFPLNVQTAILDTLTDPHYGFNPLANLRFRSSTNVEDTEDFIGAGLYESYSGCLADDLDDNNGPCECDPNRASERSVFRAIRRTFASFYNDNAFLERLRHHVNESDVGMAVLVHHSFPDPLERANGVATVEFKGEDENTTITLVTQLGAVSVTNPQDNSIAEVVVTDVSPTGRVFLNSRSTNGLERQSSLVLLGETVMEWADDYIELAEMLVDVSHQFRTVTGKTDYILDLEYKKMAPGGEVLPAGGLVIKQVREVPTPDQTRMRTPFLINDPQVFELYQGEFNIHEQADVFANHRLKSRWTLETHNMRLDSQNLSEGLYDQIHIEYLDEDKIETVSGALASMTSFSHLFVDPDAIDRWTFDHLANTRDFTLHTTHIPTSVSVVDNPVFTLADFGAFAANTPIQCLNLGVRYARPVPSINQDRDFVSFQEHTSHNDVTLWRVQDASDEDVYTERSLSREGVTVETSFYFAPVPAGHESWNAIAGATAPLKRWVQTTIEGLTTEPIMLRDYYSQTYRPEHHNETEHFLFEPRLEPGMSADTLNQLSEADIRFIHVIVDHIYDDINPDQSRITTYGFDGP